MHCDTKLLRWKGYKYKTINKMQCTYRKPMTHTVRVAERGHTVRVAERGQPLSDSRMERAFWVCPCQPSQYVQVTVMMTSISCLLVSGLLAKPYSARSKMQYQDLYNTVKLDTLWCNTKQDSTVQCKSLEFNTIHRCITEVNTIQNKTTK